MRKKWIVICSGIVFMALSLFLALSLTHRQNGNTKDVIIQGEDNGTEGVSLEEKSNMASLESILDKDEGVAKVEEKTVVRKARTSVHDPSIAKVGDTYYVFGSHIEAAKSKDLINWEKFTNAYKTPNNVLYGDLSSNLAGSFLWAGENDSDCLGGFSVWAPDSFWNPYYMNEDGTAGAYMIYYSASSTYKRSCMGFAVGKDIEGPYTYVDTIIYSGFTKEDGYDKNSKINTNYRNTNIKRLIDEDVLEGASNSWFTRDGSYNTSNSPNAIDSELFFDADGKLWMTYGSWSGGIFILEMNKETGRPIYPGKDSVTEGGNTVDRYFGTKIAVGYTKSGEGPFILYDEETSFYYLFVTYGGLAANGGYNMRLFRSTNPDGPYTDSAGKPATLPGNIDHSSYGIKLIGNYTFSCLRKGYKAAGHNSALIDDDGQRFLIYHTRFNDGTEGHQVRVHQMFINQDGWPVVAPYEYNNDVISSTGYGKDIIVGEYEFINHGKETNPLMLKTKTIQLNNDYTITGDVIGIWVYQEGSYHMSIDIGGITYKGVFFLQSDESIYATRVMTFTAIGSNNVSIWGSKIN